MIFFTRNGKKLEDAFVGFNKHNVFPTIGADGPCSVHVNLGQAGFVFIEANVKKWGLAPQMGTLAPPPAYGSEGGSILLESATAAAAHAPASSSTPPISHHRRTSSLVASASSAAAALSSPTQPIRPSPLRHSHSRHTSSASSRSNSNGSEGGERGEEEDVHNPPTPGLLDISLHSMHRFPDPVYESDEEERRDEVASDEEEEEERGVGETVPLVSPQQQEERQQQVTTDGASARSVSPPAYNPVDPYVRCPSLPSTQSRLELTNRSIAHRCTPPELPKRSSRTPSPPPQTNKVPPPHQSLPPPSQATPVPPLPVLPSPVCRLNKSLSSRSSRSRGD